MTALTRAAAGMGVLALAAAAAALGHTQVVSDPDEPNLTAGYDIEWAAVDHPPSVRNQLVRHTIKTRAAYGPARTPRLYFRVLRSGLPRKYHSYRVYGTIISGPDGRTPVVRVEKPVGGPDTVSYTFDLRQIGNPPAYEWRAATPNLDVDRVPDEGWIKHKVAP